MPDRAKKRVDTVVLKQNGRFGGFYLFRQYISLWVETHGFQSIDGIAVLAGARIAEVDSFPPKIVNGIYTGIHGSHQGH